MRHKKKYQLEPIKDPKVILTIIRISFTSTEFKSAMNKKKC